MSGNDKKKDGFIVQAGILATAGIIVRIIGILYNSPLTAIIGDEGNGYYNAAYNIYTIILLISSYSIPSAIAKVIAQKLAVKEYRNAHRIFKCALLYVLVIGSVASLFVFFFADFLVADNSAVVLRVLAPTIFFYGILGVLRGYFQAHRSMLQTSVSQIFEQILNAAVSIGLAYTFTQMVADEDATTRAIYGAMGGAIGTGAGVIFALLFMWGVYGINKKTISNRIRYDKHKDVESYKHIFKIIFLVVTPFILITFAYNASTSVNQSLFSKIMMIVKEKPEPEVAALYGVLSKAFKISNIPLALSSAMSAALLPGISADFAQGKKKETREKVAQAMRMSMLISIPAAAGIGVLAKPVMWVLYPQPATIDLASGLLSALSVSVIFYSMSTLSMSVLQGIGKLNAPVINALIALVIQSAILTALLLLTELDLYSIVIVTVIYSLLMCIFNQITVRRHLKYKQEWIRTFLRPSIASLIMGGVAFGVYQGIYFITSINVVSLFFAVLLGGMVYFILIIKMKAVTEEELKMIPKGAAVIRLAKKMKLLKNNAEIQKDALEIEEYEFRFHDKTDLNKKNIQPDNSMESSKSMKDSWNDMDDDDFWLD